MGIAYVIIDKDKLDSLYYPEYILDPEGMVIADIENLGATEVEKQEFPTRIKFTYSDETVVENIKNYTKNRPFLIFEKGSGKAQCEVY